MVLLSKWLKKSPAAYAPAALCPENTTQVRPLAAGDCDGNAMGCRRNRPNCPPPKPHCPPRVAWHNGRGIEGKRIARRKSLRILQERLKNREFSEETRRESRGLLE